VDQLDLFSIPQKTEKPKHSSQWPTEKQSSQAPIATVVVSDTMPRDEIHIIDSSGKVKARVVPVEPEDKYGDEYLAKGIARWSVYCFLWKSEGGDVCAPYFGDSLDSQWKPRWIDIAQAKSMLRDGHYTEHSSHMGHLPGTGKVSSGTVYRYPAEHVRRRLMAEAREQHYDDDLWNMPVHIGMDRPEAHKFYKLLCALRRSAEADVRCRNSGGKDANP